MTRDLDLQAALVVRKLADNLVSESWEAEAPLIRLANDRLRAGRKEQEGSTSDWSDWAAARAAAGAAGAAAQAAARDAAGDAWAAARAAQGVLLIDTLARYGKATNA